MERYVALVALVERDCAAISKIRLTQMPGRDRIFFWLRKAVVTVVVAVVFGWVYGWASPLGFRNNQPADFKFGLVHGALMPLSLPTLLMGKNVEIYASENSGRGYKIGYICGLNACGLIFFGSLFWNPKVKKTSPDKFQ